MKDVLWYVLAGTRGGENRARILRVLDEHPQNANRLADTLDLDYKTVRHHLDVLMENGVVAKAGDGYGAVYRISDRAQTNWDEVADVLGQVEDR